MTALINAIQKFIHCSDGTVFSEKRSLRNNSIDFEAWAFERKHIERYPIVSIKQLLILDDDREIPIPMHEVLVILPDRTGVLAIFGQEPSKFSESKVNPWFFEFPNNAAIYNADGSLRFQLKIPLGIGDYIGVVHTGTMPNKYKDNLGVLVGTIGHDPEWLCAVDPNDPYLIATGQWVRY